MNTRILILLAALGTGLLHADSVSYTVTPDAGQFLYQFTLSNTGDTGGTLFDLFLSLPIDIGNIDTASIGTPVGWGDATGGLLFFGPDAAPSTSFIDWASDFSGAFDVGIGSSLSGFSFLASVDIDQPVLFSPNGSPTFDPAQQTPEPGTFVLLLSIVGAVGFRVRFRHLQRRSG